MSEPRSMFAVLREAINSRDPVTGTLHQSAFARAVQNWIGGGAAARRPSSSLVLVQIDWTTRAGRTGRPGRRQADAALRQVAEITGSCLRTTDVLGRTAHPDTLGVLLPSTPAQQAEHVSRRIRAAVGERTLKHGIPVTVSIGLATGLVTDPWASAAEALADAQLDGGNRIVVAAAAPRHV
ncbi:MAG: diguanylate cyclase [Solirubrobacteraceae bacterium]|nr:diguanylate cyclase [Solirubrobacteraceae bacterium]